jgi:hypothetical protein
MKHDARSLPRRSQTLPLPRSGFVQVQVPSTIYWVREPSPTSGLGASWSPRGKRGPLSDVAAIDDLID